MQKESGFVSQVFCFGQDFTISAHCLTARFSTQGLSRSFTAGPGLSLHGTGPTCSCLISWQRPGEFSLRNGVCKTLLAVNEKPFLATTPLVLTSCWLPFGPALLHESSETSALQLPSLNMAHQTGPLEQCCSVVQHPNPNALFWLLLSFRSACIAQQT